MIRRKQSARTVQRVVDNFERLSGLNKFSSLSSCSRSDKEGLLINGPYQMSDMLGQHESKDQILSCEKGISLLFQYFLCFFRLCSTAKKWGGQCPPRPPGPPCSTPLVLQSTKIFYQNTLQRRDASTTGKACK